MGNPNEEMAVDVVMSGLAPRSERMERHEEAAALTGFSPIEHCLIQGTKLLTYLSCCCCLSTFETVPDYQRVVHLRYGKMLHKHATGGGLYLVLPFGVDQIMRVDTREVTLDIPRQTVVLSDSLSVTVDGVLYYQVYDPNKAVFGVQNLDNALSMLSQTKLREVLGTKTFQELQSHRVDIVRELEEAIDPPTDPWGVSVRRVELSDVVLPASLTRAMAIESEAHRKANAKVIEAEGEKKAAETLAEAAKVLSSDPNAMQLRFLQTLTNISAEKNSTIVVPFPTELTMAAGSMARAASAYADIHSAPRLEQ